jgi:hypothetical protein
MQNLVGIGKNALLGERSGWLTGMCVVIHNIMGQCWKRGLYVCVHKMSMLEGVMGHCGSELKYGYELEALSATF